MYSINQNIFKFQDGVCRLASAIHMVYNNILKKPITEIEDIERFAKEENDKPMSSVGCQIACGLNIMIPYTKKYHKKLPKTMECELFSNTFELHINKGRCIAININSSKEFQTMRKTKNKIEGDLSGVKKNGHWLCIFKKDGKYYLLNSWYGDSRDIKEVDINTKGLFKNTTATVLY